MVSDKERADNKTPCFRKKIGGMTYHVEVHFSKDSRQRVEDKLKRVIYFAAQSNEVGKNTGNGKSDYD